ncbi:MAG: hypothetical protein RIQ93_1930 [Verrucomicrobiota bacterium]|jgi:putative membrane-bound dehydrogenase-like protein
MIHSLTDPCSLLSTAIQSGRRGRCGLLAILVAASAPLLPAARHTGEPEIQSQPLSPEESLRRFRIQDGLRIEMVASEPLISDPVDVAWDEKGRMFVVENLGYNARDGVRPRSRIRLLEDTDGDGRMDRGTTYAEDLDYAQGVAVVKGGLLVTTNTSILFLRDTNGDGKADSQELIFEVKPSLHVDRQMSAPRRGIDNWVYINLGLFKQELSRPGNPPHSFTLTSNFRYHPLTGAYEPSAGAGQFGKGLDDWGHEFCSTNRSPALFAVLPQRFLARNPAALLTRTEEDIIPAGGDGKVFPLQNFRTTSSAHAGTFTAACGTGVYRGDLLGREILNNIFVCEPTGALVSRWILEPAGASFRGHRAQPGREFLAANDEWFRPVNVTTGPDGALYVVDMYRRFLDGARFFPDDYVAANDMAAGSDRGRIYRIVPARAATIDSRRNKVPEDPAKRVALLEHANGWHRDTAQRLLVEAGDPSVVPAVEAVLRRSKFAQARLQALWTIEGLNALTAQHVTAALQDAEAGVLENALWLAARFTPSDAGVLQRVVELASHAAARVRFAALLVAGDAPSPAAQQALVRAGIRDSQDAWMRAAILSSPLTQSGGVLATLLRDPVFVAGGTRGNIELVRRLAAVLAAQGVAAELKPALEAMGSGNAAAQSNWWQLALVSGVADGLRGQKTPTLPRTIAALMAKPPAELAHSLAGMGEVIASAPGVLNDRSRAVSERIAAVAMLEHLPSAEAAPLVGKLLARSEALEVQQAALDLFSHFDRRTLSPVLYGQLAEMGGVAKTGAMQYLQRNPMELLQRIKAGAINPALIDATGRWMMLNSADANIRALGQEVFGQAEGDRKALIRRYAKALGELPGSAMRGKEVFTQTCTMCHRFRGDGAEVGPDITDVRIKTPEMLLSDILDPNNSLEPRFEAYTIKLAGGRELVGVIASETNDALVVNSLGGSETISRSNLQNSKPLGVSLMPQGLEASLTEPRMADLLAYLRSDPDAK